MAQACPWHRAMFFLGRWPGHMLETVSGIRGRVWERGAGTVVHPGILAITNPLTKDRTDDTCK